MCCFYLYWLQHWPDFILYTGVFKQLLCVWIYTLLLSLVLRCLLIIALFHFCCGIWGTQPSAMHVWYVFETRHRYKTLPPTETCSYSYLECSYKDLEFVHTSSIKMGCTAKSCLCRAHVSLMFEGVELNIAAHMTPPCENVNPPRTSVLCLSTCVICATWYTQCIIIILHIHAHMINPQGL